MNDPDSPDSCPGCGRTLCADSCICWYCLDDDVERPSTPVNLDRDETNHGK